MKVGKLNGYIFRGSNSSIVILASLLNRDQLFKEKIGSPGCKFFSIRSRPVFGRGLSSSEANRKSHKLFPFVKWRENNQTSKFQGIQCISMGSFSCPSVFQFVSCYVSFAWKSFDCSCLVVINLFPFLVLWIGSVAHNKGEWWLFTSTLSPVFAKAVHILLYKLCYACNLLVSSCFNEFRNFVHLKCDLLLYNLFGILNKFWVLGNWPVFTLLWNGH